MSDVNSFDFDPLAITREQEAQAEYEWEARSQYDSPISAEAESAFKYALDQRRSFVSEEDAFKYALDQRSNITKGLKDGTLSCLPGADGFADTQPVFNIITDNAYNGANLLYLKQYQKDRNFPTGEFVTSGQYVEAINYVHSFGLEPGEKGFEIHFSEPNKYTGKYENKKDHLINLAQFDDPQILKQYAFVNKQGNCYGDYTPPKYLGGAGPTIVCKSADPIKYLGQYFAAVSMGGKFQVSQEQAKEFSQKLEASLNKKMDIGFPDPFKLSKICNDAVQYSKEFIKEINSPKVAQEHKQDQKQKRKKGRSL